MNVSAELQKERQLILKYLDLLERYSKAKWNETAPNAEIFVNFIQDFADRYHHSKEEDILFEHLNSPGVLTHCNPVQQMLFEHNEGRNYTNAMIEAMKKNQINDLKVNAASYCMLLRDHIAKEDNILYPMAENNLSNEDKEIIEQKYQQVDCQWRRIPWK